MLIKQSIINDADIKSVLSIRFVTRRPITGGFRVEPNEVRFVSRKPLHYWSSRYDKFHLSTRRPITGGFRVKPNEVRFVSRKPLSVFSIHFVTRTPTMFKTKKPSEDLTTEGFSIQNSTISYFKYNIFFVCTTLFPVTISIAIIL